MIDSRQPQWDLVRRRRECLFCEHRFSTEEREEKDPENIPNYGIVKIENQRILAYKFPDGLKITIGKRKGGIMIEGLRR